MRRLNITLRIWLSINVFILGYVLSTALHQIHGRETRAAIRTASEARFPAAQLGQAAEAAFDRMVKGFGDAVVMQDASGLERAAEDGRATVGALRSVAAINGLGTEASDGSRKLADSVERLLADARMIYGAVLQGGASGDAAEQMRGMAARTEEAKAALTMLKERLAGELLAQLDEIEEASARQNR